MEARHRADFDAIGMAALDAGIRHDKGHGQTQYDGKDRVIVAPWQAARRGPPCATPSNRLKSALLRFCSGSLSGMRERQSLQFLREGLLFVPAKARTTRRRGRSARPRPSLQLPQRCSASLPFIPEAWLLAIPLSLRRRCRDA
ncbi:hypothetical protein D3C81_1332260 [compost metagenome]